MRVLVFAPAAPPYGGMALQAQQLVHHLSNDGVDVAFLATNFPLPAMLDRVPGIRTMARALLIWFKLAAARRYDVVHIFAASWWYFFLAVAPAVIVGRALGRRVVLNYRGGEAEAFFAHWGWLAAPIVRMATAVTAPSGFVATAIERRFGVPVRIVPNILDHSRFTFRARPTLRPRLLVTRHLEAPYDVEAVLRAFRVIQSHDAAASLWIAGTGPEESRLRRLADEWQLRDVRFLGGVPHADLPQIYNDCDIYVNASRIDNFPAALIEAAAAGLPVVTTAAGGIPHVFETGRSAVMVAVGDHDGLARGVMRLLADPAMARELVRAAREVARACDWSRVRGHVLESYGVAVDGGVSPQWPGRDETLARPVQSASE